MSSSSDVIEIRANIAVHVCDQCEEKFSLNASACPRCGASAEPQLPESVGINKAKISALGDLLPHFAALASLDPGSRQPSMSVADEQIIFFLNHSDVWEAMRMDRLQDMAIAVDLSSEERARSKETRAAFEALLVKATELRRVHDSLSSTRAPQGLSEFIDVLLDAATAALTTYDICARFLLATTVEDVALFQQELQSAMDRAAAAAAGLSERLSRAQIESDDVLQARLAIFTGRDGGYTSAGRVDLAQVLIDGMSVSGSAIRLGELAKPYFGSALRTPPNELPEELSTTCYLMASAVAVSHDPITLRQRAESLAGILRDGFSANPTHMGRLFVDAQPEIEDAMVALISVGDIALLSNIDDLPKEALRLAVSQHYGTLTEAVFKRLVNVVLGAKFVLAGKPERYADTAMRKFGDKCQILSQESDWRYADCLRGVATVARNAGAHGDVDLSGDMITFTQVDRKGRVHQEQWTDEEFHARLLDLLTTCLALRLAYDGVSADHYQQIGEVPGPTKRRVVVELSRAIVGRWGLSKAKVSDEESGVVTVDGVHQDGPPRMPIDYLPAAFTLATLLRTVEHVELRVSSNDSLHCRIRVPVEEALRFQGADEDARFFTTLRIMYLATIEPRDGDIEHRYRNEWITVIARSLGQKLSELGAARRSLPDSVPEYERSLRTTMDFCESATKHVSQLPPPSDEAAEVRDTLAEALRLLQSGLADYLARAKARDWSGMRRGSPVLERAGELLVPLLR